MPGLAPCSPANVASHMVWFHGAVTVIKSNLVVFTILTVLWSVTNSLTGLPWAGAAHHTDPGLLRLVYVSTRYTTRPTPARQTSHSKIMGINNMELVLPLLL